MILNGTWFTQFPNPNKLRVIRALVFEAAGEALRSWNFAAYFCPLANEGMMNLCAKFSKFLFSSDESSLLYPNPCVALIKQKDWLCDDQRWTEDGQAWFYVLKLENELNTRLDWLVMRNLFSRSDISSNFSISFSISSNFSVLVPSAELPPKGKNCKLYITPIFQFHRQRSACRCAKNVHCSQYQTTLTFTATRLLIWKRKVLNVLLFLFKMHTLRILARFVMRSFPNSSALPQRVSFSRAA